jgi:hypothetical protein
MQYKISAIIFLILIGIWQCPIGDHTTITIFSMAALGFHKPAGSSNYTSARLLPVSSKTGLWLRTGSFL